jgi:hypothetical protein
MADAQDLKFHFWLFHGALNRFNKLGFTLDFIAQSPFHPHQLAASIQMRLVSQKVSQFPAA